MIDRKKLYKWCADSAEELKKSKDLKVRLRVVKDSAEMGEIMARDLVEEIKAANRENRECRAIIPCGPKSWYKPFTRICPINRKNKKTAIVFTKNVNMLAA